MLTFSEKLRQKIGHKVTCVFCHQKKYLTTQWRINTERKAVCPECLLSKGVEIGATVSF